MLVQAFLPLFKQFDNNVLAAAINPNVDPNVLKDPTTADAQKVLDPFDISGNIKATLDNVPPLVFQQGSSASKP